MSLRDQALAPNRPITEATFTLAWDLLLKQGQGHDATDDERCRAKCWLTYRAAEGMVTFADWVDKVNPLLHDIAFLNLSVEKAQRWTASQSSAEVYLEILQKPGLAVLEAGRIAEVVAHKIAEKCLDYCPTVQNYLRLTAIAAYAKLLTGEDGEAVQMVEDAIITWRSVMRFFDNRKHIFRWIESRDDMFVLMALSYIRERAEKGKVRVASFMSPLELRRQQETQHWMKCLLRLEGNNGGMWSDEVPE
jgi:hypothetical protein